jgi:hypothetical protein
MAIVSHYLIRDVLSYNLWGFYCHPDFAFCVKMVNNKGPCSGEHLSNGFFQEDSVKTENLKYANHYTVQYIGQLQARERNWRIYYSRYNSFILDMVRKGMAFNNELDHCKVWSFKM